MTIGHLALSFGGAAGVAAVYEIGNLVHKHWREKHPKPPEAAHVNPDSFFKIFMNDLGYIRDHATFDSKTLDFIRYSPWPNPNPDTLIGRLATRKGYFKRK